MDELPPPAPRRRAEPRPGLILVLALAPGLAACTSELCRPENLPHEGVARTPEELFEIAQQAARNDCSDELHSLLSKKTRDEHGELSFSLAWDSIKIPDPYDYKVANVVKSGKFLGVITDKASGRRFIYVDYQEPGKKDLLAQLYVVTERDEEGREVFRLALQEQVESQDTPHPLYFTAAPP
jgi:hypothetical protein